MRSEWLKAVERKRKPEYQRATAAAIRSCRVRSICERARHSRALTDRFTMVSQCTRSSALQMATVPSFAVPAHASAFLDRSWWGRGIVTLDLLNCTEVRSVPTPMHPTAQDDVGTIAAREQSTSATSGSGGQLGEMGLVETLCPFQLLYSDGIERLGAESARERVRWVSAIWEVLDRAVSIPDRSVTRSPTGSIRTIRSMTSATSSQSGSGSGSASTIYVPPLDSIPTSLTSISFGFKHSFSPPVLGFGPSYPCN
ncbi:hypothetical protein A0H81_03305 [Grifola frondosa]|uniref:PH domain-containing protein n=1 Tax=Grifola frondosa TaxID=5627 RepID=A0A1C7MJV5_GRIFR|nr:hypothetical protein A0H81_03305 [Grifola frondosa]